FRASCGPLDAGINVLSVLAENDNIYLFRMLHRAGHAIKIADRAHARIKVQELAQRNIQTADSATDGRRERSFDGDAECLARRQGIVGQPRIEFLEGFFAGENLKPLNLPAASRCFLDGGVENHLRSFPDVSSGTVSFNERNNRVVRHSQLRAGSRYLLSSRG